MNVSIRCTKTAVRVLPLARQSASKRSRVAMGELKLILVVSVMANLLSCRVHWNFDIYVIRTGDLTLATGSRGLLVSFCIIACGNLRFAQVLGKPNGIGCRRLGVSSKPPKQSLYQQPFLEEFLVICLRQTQPSVEVFVFLLVCFHRDVLITLILPRTNVIRAFTVNARHTPHKSNPERGRAVGLSPFTLR
jgi:hypothetical protein